MKAPFNIQSLLVLGMCGTFACNATAHSEHNVEFVSTPLVGLYASVLGGGGWMPSGVRLFQLATALYTEADGGPLAVNASGTADSSDFWLVGAQIGYSWVTKSFGNSKYCFSPSVELEGLYLGRHDIKGRYMDNKYSRLPQHVFDITLPMEAEVALVNMVFSFQHECWQRWQGYVGLGWGVAHTSVSNADAEQIIPAEAGVNHFDGDSSAASLALAFQPKIGVLYNCNSNLSFFAEYRFLYLSDTDYQFGSTIALNADHVPTTDWKVTMCPQPINIGLVGIRYTYM